LTAGSEPAAPERLKSIKTPSPNISNAVLNGGCILGFGIFRISDLFNYVRGLDLFIKPFKVVSYSVFYISYSVSAYVGIGAWRLRESLNIYIYTSFVLLFLGGITMVLYCVAQFVSRWFMVM